MSDGINFHLLRSVLSFIIFCSCCDAVYCFQIVFRKFRVKNKWFDICCCCFVHLIFAKAQVILWIDYVCANHKLLPSSAENEHELYNRAIVCVCVVFFMSWFDRATTTNQWNMFNDVKYSSNLTLMLAPPKSSHSIAQCLDVDNSVYSDIVINSNQLSNMSRTNSRRESVCESSSSSPSSSFSSLCGNETIIPVKYLIHNERTDLCNQVDNGKFCCTLEVKFVW